MSFSDVDTFQVSFYQSIHGCYSNGMPFVTDWQQRSHCKLWVVNKPVSNIVCFQSCTTVTCLKRGD